MSDLIDAKTKRELLPVLKHLKAAVRLLFFTQDGYQ
jgi:hypothetical protein